MLPFSEDRKVRLSRFAHMFHRPEYGATVHSLTSNSVFYDPTLAGIVQRLKEPATWREIKTNLEGSAQTTLIEDLLAQMADANLIVPADYDEMKYLQEVRSSVLCGPNFDILFMLTTDACNLDCTYCFINGSKPEGYKDSMMSAATAMASIDAFERWKSPEGEKSVVFYGGEPLLNMPAFVATLEYLEKKIEEGVFKSDIDRILITNGTLIDGSVARLIAQHKVFPYVSIDGPPELHNRQRPRKCGGGSYEMAVAGLQALRAVGIDPGISVTVTNEMLDTLPEILEWLVVNLEVKAVGFNMLESIPGRKYFGDDYGERFAEALLQCQEVCDCYGVYEERVMRKTKQFAKREIYVFDCAACGEQLTIAPDGQVGVCQGFVGTREFFSGNVHDPDYDPRTDPIFIQWSEISPLAHSECFDCPALGLCGGGCPRNPYLQGNGVNGIDTRFCAHVLKTQEWIIHRLYNRLYKTDV